MSLALYSSRVRANEVLDRATVRLSNGIAIDDVVACRKYLFLCLLRVPRNLSVRFGQGFAAPVGANWAKRKIVDLRSNGAEYQEVGISAPIRHYLVRQGGQRNAALKDAQFPRNDCTSLSDCLSLGS
jgi:hypothetical protein